MVSSSTVPSPSVSLVESTIKKWKATKNNANFDPVPFLTTLSEVIEKEKHHYLKLDTDPFDDRQPSLTDTHPLARILGIFMDEETLLDDISGVFLVSSEEATILVTVAARLLCSLFSVVRLTVSMETDDRLIKSLFRWAESGPEPLNVYSLCILGSLMEQQELVHATRSKNIKLIPIVMDRLKILSASMVEQNLLENDDVSEETSNGSWVTRLSDLLGSYSLEPLSITMKQRLSITYLKQLAEYQDMMPLMYNNGVLDLIYTYIDTTSNRDIRLAFEGLHLLSCLLCHRCVYMDFVDNSGLQRLLGVPRPSVAATAVSICLYFISYFDDAMERACQLPQETLIELIDYALWLLDCSHESARCYTLYFFHTALNYGLIMNIFERKHGLRYLYNAVSTRLLLNNDLSVSDSAVPTSWQIVRIGLAAIKKYMELNVLLWGDDLADGCLPMFDESPRQIANIGHRSITFTPSQLSEMVELISEKADIHAVWHPGDELERLGGIDLLFKIIFSNLMDYGGWQSRNDCIRHAMDILNTCCLVSRLMISVVNSRIARDSDSHMDGLQMILLSLNDDMLDPSVKKSALSLLCTCVCKKVSIEDEDKKHLPALPECRKRKLSGFQSSSEPSFAKFSTPQLHSLVNGDALPIPPTVTDCVRNVWGLVRRYNGIMVLLGLLETKTPISDADMIRGLACKALVGLARSPDVKNMLAKLPICTKGQLQLLMKEPVLPDKMEEHVIFCRLATNLLHQVVGNTTDNITGEISMEKIRKAEIVAKTKITYDSNELLELIYKHLLSKGFHESASTLHREAGLKVLPSAGLTTPSQLPIYNTDHLPVAKVNAPTVLFPPPSTPADMSSLLPSTPSRPNGPKDTPGSSLRLVKSKALGTPATPHRLNELGTPHRYNLQAREKLSGVQNLYLKVGHSGSSCETSLNQIVESYLTQQHAMCPNPLSVCSRFSLMHRHRCPDMRRGRLVNVTRRANNRELLGHSGSRTGRKEDRRFYYSRFMPSAVIPEIDGDVISTCCYSRSLSTDMLYLGCDSGNVGCLNMEEDSPTFLFSAHNSPIRYLTTSRDADLLISSSLISTPRTCLWRLANTNEPVLTFKDETYAEFSKLYEDKIVTTLDAQAFLYDITTGQKLTTLYSDVQCNSYTRNKATFSHTDSLVLNDGVLWDVRASGGISSSGGPVHKFDKFQSDVSGVFHPNQLDVVIGSAVWDMRTYRLLHTVNHLDRLEARFNATGDVIYAGVFNWDDDSSTLGMDSDNALQRIFRTVDALDYTLISTIDIKKDIRHIALDEKNMTLTLIEASQLSGQANEDSICRLYTVGRKRSAKEEEEEASQEADEDNDDDDDDDDDDDFDDDDDDFNLIFGEEGDTDADESRIGRRRTRQRRAAAGGTREEMGVNAEETDNNLDNNESTTDNSSDTDGSGDDEGSDEEEMEVINLSEDGQDDSDDDTYDFPPGMEVEGTDSDED